MKFRRALLLTDLLTDVRPAIAALGRVAPTLEHVLIVAALPNTRARAFFGSAAEPEEENLRSLDLLRAQGQAVARNCDVQFAAEVEIAPLVQLALDANVDLLVTASRSLYDASVLSEVHQRLALPLLWPTRDVESTRTITSMFCVPLGRTSRAAVATFLRHHADTSLRVTLLSPPTAQPDELTALLEQLAATQLTPESPRDGIASLRWLLSDQAARPEFDLLVLTRVPAAIVFGIHWPTPVLLLPLTTAEATSRQRALDLPDGLDQLRQPDSPDRPFVLFDSELSDDALRALIHRDNAEASELLAVRLRPSRDVRSIRKRLRAQRLPTHVIDASAVLDEGSALDVSRGVDSVRLARVATRLLRTGVPVASFFHHELNELIPVSTRQTPTFEQNRIEFEFNNTTARQWMLEAIRTSQRCVLLQVYMAADDDVGRMVEAALVDASGRGVAVRVLVDSLHGLHGSFGTQNTLLARLATQPGVQVRICRPLNELPSLADLKQRDHRKLIVVDEQLALVGGRNLSHEYYTGFDEAVVTPTTPWREVPWLDAGARLAGPIVTALATGFRDTWVDAGGDTFEITPAPPAGSSAARLFVHRGLHDAHTLEAYLELIEAAQTRIFLVNGFPLLLEFQHALLRAHARGVRVHVLTGHVAPTYSDHAVAEQAFAGPWAAARIAATELVHSRLDPLVEAGIHVYAFTQQSVSGWDAELGVVHPHVHAKVMSVDGLRCTVGSANFDITSSYWESELLVVVDDADHASAVEAQIGALLATSTRWDRDDPQWQKLANRRAWMRHWPGVLSL